eukprot:CAMPEP_0113880826 /NCGR_PEP_ID=MMETSP0780_2-20120614/8013_1 /TAXON_ID=652834 /ORGANISM="Palpitomonas bilix" /LENGTH=166 /DNA_ID=CAMNT_0000867569 /DNA_START=63 /DNA_END=563 /DNA_ORIENTATION=+ /assembly_acc=CAM_ASM_000599
MSAYGNPDAENGAGQGQTGGAPDYGGPTAAPNQPKGTRIERARMLTTNTLDELGRIDGSTSKNKKIALYVVFGVLFAFVVACFLAVLSTSFTGHFELFMMSLVVAGVFAIMFLQIIWKNIDDKENAKRRWRLLIVTISVFIWTAITSVTMVGVAINRSVNNITCIP